MQLQENYENSLSILFLFPRYHTNQISITQILQKKGHKVHFHVKFYGKIENYQNLKPVLFEESILSKFLKKIFFFKKDINSLYFPKLFKYIKFLKNLNLDIVIIRIHGRIYTYTLAFIIKFILKKKIIFYEQANSNLEHINGNSLFKFIRKIEFYIRLKLFSARWCTPLHYLENKLPKNCFYLPFTVNKKHVLKNYSDKFRILIIGKFQNRKNQLMAVKLLEELIRNKKINLTIVGEVTTKEHIANFDKLNVYLEKNHLKEKVKIFKNIENNTIEKFYLNCDLFFLPSYNEPASISILEAMSYGIPSICHKTCGTKTYIKNNYNGFVLNKFNKHNITSLIQNLIRDRKLIKELSLNSIEHYTHYYDQEVFYKYFKKLIY